MTFTEPPDWHQHAACAGTDPDLFFPGRGVPITDARRVCATCPVKAECLDYAIRNGETIGVWGGTSERERRAMRSAIIGYVRPPRWTGGPDAQDGRGDGADYDGYGGFTAATTTTLGWTSCPCGAPFTPGTVLDPFAGTGTTLAVADLHGRDAIGIDIDARNQQLYEQRRAECARNLFDSPMPDANQLDLFGGVA